MSALARFLKTTVLGGAVFLLPVTIVLYLGVHAFAAIRGVLSPIQDHFPGLQILGIGAATLLTLAALLLICFIAGLLARTVSARGLKTWVENKLVIFIPGYSFLRSIAHGALGQAASDDLMPALVKVGDLWQLGFVADQLPDGRRVVYVPEAPEALSGAVLLIPPGDVRLLAVSVPDALKSLKRYGVGTASLIASGGSAS